MMPPAKEARPSLLRSTGKPPPCTGSAQVVASRI